MHLCNSWITGAPFLMTPTVCEKTSTEGNDPYPPSLDIGRNKPLIHSPFLQSGLFPGHSLSLLHPKYYIIWKNASHQNIILLPSFDITYLRTFHFYKLVSPKDNHHRQCSFLSKHYYAKRHPTEGNDPSPPSLDIGWNKPLIHTPLLQSGLFPGHSSSLMHPK